MTAFVQINATKLMSCKIRGLFQIIVPIRCFIKCKAHDSVG